jgi:hypothetical protein
MDADRQQGLGDPTEEGMKITRMTTWTLSLAAALLAFAIAAFYSWLVGWL